MKKIVKIFTMKIIFYCHNLCLLQKRKFWNFPSPFSQPWDPSNSLTAPPPPKLCDTINFELVIYSLWYPCSEFIKQTSCWGPRQGIPAGGDQKLTVSDLGTVFNAHRIQTVHWNTTNAKIWWKWKFQLTIKFQHLVTSSSSLNIFIYLHVCKFF